MQQLQGKIRSRYSSWEDIIMKKGMPLFVVLLMFISIFGFSPAFADEETEPLWSNINIYAVRNNPEKVKLFSVKLDAKPIHLDRISTYHWNNGKGAKPGTIGVYYEDGTLITSWQATGRGTPDKPNLYWDAYVDFIMLPGYTYMFKVSDNSSWSWNPESEGCGMIELYGEQLDNFNEPAENTNQVTGSDSSVCAEPARDMKIVINNETLAVNNADGIPVSPLVLDNTVYIPVEVVSEIIGQDVIWDKEKNTVYFGIRPDSGPGWRLFNTKYELFDEEDSDVYYQTYSFEGVRDDRVVFKQDGGCRSGDQSWYRVAYYECEIPPSFIKVGQEVPLEVGLKIRNSWRGKDCWAFISGNSAFYSGFIGSYGHQMTSRDGSRYVVPGNMVSEDGDWSMIIDGKAWNDRPFNGQTSEIVCQTDVGTYTWEYEYQE